jgi:hypothetical protein
MTHITRDIAKFFSGWAAAETVGHWWMGTWGRELLPMELGWFTFTPAINTFAMTAWPIVLAGLVYFGWFYKGEPTFVEPAPPIGRRGATA